jgi:hypothetical protein
MLEDVGHGVMWLVLRRHECELVAVWIGESAVPSELIFLRLLSDSHASIGEFPASLRHALICEEKDASVPRFKFSLRAELIILAEVEL